MSSFLSPEARRELEEHLEAQKSLQIDTVVNETISSEELNLALESLTGVEAVEAAEAVEALQMDVLEMPSTSCAKAKQLEKQSAKRKIIMTYEDDDVFENPPSREIPALPSNGKNMALARKTIKKPSVRSLSRTPSTSSSKSSAAPEDNDWLELINEELQRRAEFRRRIDGGYEGIQKKN